MNNRSDESIIFRRRINNVSEESFIPIPFQVRINNRLDEPIILFQQGMNNLSDESIIPFQARMNNLSDESFIPNPFQLRINNMTDYSNGIFPIPFHEEILNFIDNQN